MNDPFALLYELKWAGPISLIFCKHAGDKIS